MHYTLISTGEWATFADMTIGRTFLYLHTPWVKITDLHAARLTDNSIFRITPALQFLLMQFRQD